MELKILRYGSTSESSGGALSVEGNFHCHTVEDEYRKHKVPGETRIYSGRYEIKLRTEGRMHAQYAEKYDWHKGMLWLQNVPQFEWIYIHIGGTEAQTDGCILVGYTALSKNGFEVQRSLEAYKALYLLILAAIDRGERVWVTIIDGDL